MSRLLPLLLFATALAARVHAEPFIVAHRGASKDAPENTLPAFKLAWEQEADAIEGDFHLTMDKQVVCFHDGNTKNLTGVKKVIRQSTLDELKKLDVGLKFGKKWAGTRMPTLDEVLATVPAGKKIFVEIKCGPEILDAFFDARKRSGLKKEQVVVISFDDKVIQKAKFMDHDMKAYWLASIQRDGRTGTSKPHLKSILHTLRECGADGFSSNYRYLDLNLVEQIREAGYEYHFWTVDDPKLAEKFISLGAKSITSNVPGVMKNYFRR